VLPSSPVRVIMRDSRLPMPLLYKAAGLTRIV
jgi:hypothetical protein